MWDPPSLHLDSKYSRWAMSVEFFSCVQDRLFHCCFGVVASLRPTDGTNFGRYGQCNLPCASMLGYDNLAHHAVVAIESVLKQASVQRENKRALLADDARDCKRLSVHGSDTEPPPPNGVDVGLMKDEEDDHQHLPDDPKPSVTA